MIIQCKTNLFSDLPKDCLVETKFNTHETRLVVEKNYVVYAMILNSGYIWYFLEDEDKLYYPFAYPAPFFKVLNGNLSRYWIYSTEIGKDKNSSRTIWTYPEWANDPYFYNQLTDGKREALEVFKKYKELMDIEFPLPSIPEAASALDEEWLMCHFCLDAWQSTSKDGMVICPKCKRMMHNPRYPGRH